MANKIKDIIPNNLLKIREKLEYTQKDLSEILDVSERMICNYEIGESNLPIDKAVLLSQKYNYSLDWIYCNTQNDFVKTEFENYTEEENKNFLVDIRNFITISDDKITFSINNSYWKYLNRVKEIKSSDRTSKEQIREISELNGIYKSNDNTNITMGLSFKISDFVSMISFDNSSCTCCFDNNSDNKDITEENIKEATDFLKSLIDN